MTTASNTADIAPEMRENPYRNSSIFVFTRRSDRSGDRSDTFTPELMTPLGMAHENETGVSLDDYLVRRGLVPMSQRQLVLTSTISDKMPDFDGVTTDGIIAETVVVYLSGDPVCRTLSLMVWYPPVSWVEEQDDFVPIPTGWCADVGYGRCVTDLDGVMVTSEVLTELDRLLVPMPQLSRMNLVVPAR